MIFVIFLKNKYRSKNIFLNKFVIYYRCKYWRYIGYTYSGLFIVIIFFFYKNKRDYYICYILNDLNIIVIVIFLKMFDNIM